MKNKYNIGDKVRIVGDEKSAILKKESYGKVATISEIYGGGYPYVLDINDGYCYRDSELAPAVGEKIVITTDGKTTLARLYENNKVIKRAEAKCCPDDEFDFKIGAELAFNRLMEKPADEWRVVKRKAKKGDYIRLTKKTFSFNEVGDILKVHEMIAGLVEVLEKDHPRGGSGEALGKDYAWHYRCDDYEVIEHVKEKASKPERYNGKVVCIKTVNNWWTVGKVYEVKDGIITADNGFKYPRLDNYRYKDAEDVRHAGCTSGTNYNHCNEFVPLVKE